MKLLKKIHYAGWMIIFFVPIAVIVIAVDIFKWLVVHYKIMDATYKRTNNENIKK